jgi:hypothetical protein|uniref:Uncharacterized protein n=1 Tax=Populus trichocarpa TaxID=3694 RepID=A0A3N7EJX0_POPTR|eukprot:XP_024438934.1 uncharacterized protein LOC112323788 [Populus trichocarpa]
MVRLIGIKWQEEEDLSGVTSTRRSEEMKTRLYEHAKTFGLRLKMKEMDKEALVTEMKKTKKRGIRSEWLAFNCAVGLPQMGKGKSASSLVEFLRLANDSIRLDGEGVSGTRGIITIARESKALSEVGLQAWRMREDSLMEAKELIRETESFYCAAIEGVKENQLVLSYMGIPLVKVSSWT